MPVDTNSNAWESGVSINTLHQRVINHLQSNPEKAFRKSDIRKVVYGDSGSDDGTDTDALVRLMQTTKLDVAISQLLADGVVDGRQLDITVQDDAGEKIQTPLFYTYARDGN